MSRGSCANSTAAQGTPQNPKYQVLKQRGKFRMQQRVVSSFLMRKVTAEEVCRVSSRTSVALISLKW